MTDQYSACFCHALVEGDLETLRTIPKGDRHLHASRGCGRKELQADLAYPIPAAPDDGFSSLEQMQQWVDTHIRPQFPGTGGWLKKIDAMFRSACADGITFLEPSFTLRDIEKFGSVEGFWAAVNGIYQKYAGQIFFSPCLSVRTRDDLDFTLPRVERALAYGVFRAIDLCNQEGVRPYGDYRPIYEIAAHYGVCKKAHVGEFGTADMVMEAITQLQLDEVQHGIAVASSPKAMELAKERNVCFHVCPASNICLKTARDYSSHPIQIMAQNKLRLTIGTDDLLVFDATVSQEYLRLFQSGCLTPEQLDQIRINSLAIR